MIIFKEYKKGLKFKKLLINKKYFQNIINNLNIIFLNILQLINKKLLTLYLILKPL